MPRSNDRPLLMGTHGAITSGHYLATAAGHRIALQGGNAVDIAAAVGLCLSVLEPAENTPGGEAPMLVYSAEDRRVHAISGVGWSPAALTLEWCRANGLALIPDANFVPALVPAMMGSWLLALARFGTMSFAQVAQPALALAAEGFPLYPRLRRTLLAAKAHLMAMHPTTCAVYLPGGEVAEVGARIANPDLADVLAIMCRAEADAAHHGRRAGLEAAGDAFYRGPIVERILTFIRDNPLPDNWGTPRAGLLSYDDFAEWHATIEEPVSIDHQGLRVYKCSAWTQGPTFLQQLRLLEGMELPALGHQSAAYIHAVLESTKLAFADREAYYGDPCFRAMPFDTLFSREYAAQRRQLIGDEASLALRPGDVGGGIPDYVAFDPVESDRRALGLDVPGGHVGDTTHLDVVDARGNMVAATPSGGWLINSPVIPGVGFPLGNRAQAFDLHPARPNALEPRKRPRITLTPTLVTRDGEPLLAFGMRGGDVQDQRTLHFFLAHVLFGMDIQAALDIPSFYSEHFPSSFFPRKGYPGRVTIEARIGDDVLDALRARGHALNVTDEQLNNTMCVRRDPHGVMMAGVCSTGEQAYGLAW